jgi:hypothetical protein
MFNRPNVMLCYFDESGDEQPLRRPDELLVFVLVAIVVDQAHIGKLQQDFLALKLQTLSARDRQTIGTSALVKFERKGSQFRRALKQQKRGSRRASLGFLDAFIQILESNQISIEFAYRLKGSARLSSDSYAESVAEILTSVNNHAQLHDARFLAVLDSRTHAKNAPTVAYVFDQMTTAHQPLSRLIEPRCLGTATRTSCCRLPMYWLRECLHQCSVTQSRENNRTVHLGILRSSKNAIELASKLCELTQ